VKKKHYNAKDYGNDFEKKVDEWAEKAGLRQENDAIVTDSRKRTTGKFDRRYKLDGYDMCLELKTTAKDSISFNDEWFLQQTLKTSNGLKHHQIRNLVKEMNKKNHAGFLIEYRKQEKVIFVEISKFICWAIDTTKKSLSCAEAMVLGLEVDNMEWVKEE
jgi:penicillin-binding protein-related factor A (putative recombinase)